MNLKTGIRILTILLCLFTFPNLVISEDNYIFERMWPTLQQPWYFHMPHGVAINKKGHVFVVDSYNNRIMKFTSEGQFISLWGSFGTAEGEFNFPTSIVLDQNDNVYVLDQQNERIQKFDSNGKFILMWGNSGSGNGEFDQPQDVTVDKEGNVYVTDMNNHRIQKFSSYGNYIKEFSGMNQFRCSFLEECDYPTGIAVDENGYIYVVESHNGMIQKFDKECNLVKTWGSQGTEDGQFDLPQDIAVNNGYIYVADYYNHRIQQFSLEGVFINKWGKEGASEGDFKWPKGIAIDAKGDIFVADTSNNRIQKFDSKGIFLKSWASYLSGNGKFKSPQGIDIDEKGNVYVLDTVNHCIQKFSWDGQFILKWGSEGTGDGEFHLPRDIAVDKNGNVYVADPSNQCIQKFNYDGKFLGKWSGYSASNITVNKDGYVFLVDNNYIKKIDSDGSLITQWGVEGSGGIATDNNGNIYFGDSKNFRIRKFDSEGNLITQWGKEGSGDGEFKSPSGIAIDTDGNVFITDRQNNRIQKFTSDGQFLSGFGEYGSYIGLVNDPEDIAVDQNGRVYVCETGNNRIQVFNEVCLSTNAKAIVVAGGGSFTENDLWDTTQMCANFAYRTLTYRGFTKKTIWYLSSDTDLDLDNNNEFDDVDDDATNENLNNAITEWAKDADELVIYLTDHGGNESFQMSGTEVLSAEKLESWLDEIQNIIPGKVIVIYDACESGSFISQLTPPPGKQRIIITSTSPEEFAQFVSQGSISFSNFFWTNIFNGLDVNNAFINAKTSIESLNDFQHPLLDADGNGKPNEDEDMKEIQCIYIGNGTETHEDGPVIGNISPNQTITGTNQALLYADNVIDNDGIDRVWAVIYPPNSYLDIISSPVQEFLSVDLMPVGNGRYESQYDYFNIEGSYQIYIHAKDRIGNICNPILTTVSVENPLIRRAVVVVGGSEFDPEFNAFRSIAENLGKLVYEALCFQGYSKDELFFLSPITISDGVDGLPELSNLKYAITQWANENTQDVVIYMLGNGDNGNFEINTSTSAKLSAKELDEWLDILQSNTSIMVTFIYDAPSSGSFIETLKPEGEQKRILITGSDFNQPAYFLSQGNISFSQYFWRRVLNGSKVLDAFLNSSSAIRTSCFEQIPQIDDNANGIGNEFNDGTLAGTLTIGTGILLAKDNPLVKVGSESHILEGLRTASICAENVSTTKTIDKVWAVITSPSDNLQHSAIPIVNLPTIYLTEDGTGKYIGYYHDFFHKGTYQIAIYASDTRGNISMPVITNIVQTTDLEIDLGNINGDEQLDLSDAIIALRVLAGMNESASIRSDYATAIVDITDDNRIGMDEAIYILQFVSELR